MSNVNPINSQLPAGYTLLGSQTPGTTNPTSSSMSNPLASLAGNTQTFLQLLVAQMKYQDPMNPVSGTAFMAQTAQMLQASEMTQLVQTIGKETLASETASATSLIGKQVSGIDASNKNVTGVVASVTVDPTNGPTLNINTSSGTDSIALSSVTEVSPAS
jgi:flagellar basal-body rod modification protein FlgD